MWVKKLHHFIFCKTLSNKALSNNFWHSWKIEFQVELRERLGIDDIGLILVLQQKGQNRLKWYGHVLQKEDTDWVTKYMEYKVEGSRPRGRPKRTWREVVQKDSQVRILNREDAMDRSRWKKLIKIGWWSRYVSEWMFLLVPAHPGSPEKGS